MVVNNSAPFNNPNYIVNNVLLGQGVVASNISFNGDPDQLGFFTNDIHSATIGSNFSLNCH